MAGRSWALLGAMALTSFALTALAAEPAVGPAATPPPASSASPASAPAPAEAAKPLPPPRPPSGPLSPEQLDLMVPKHPGYLGALAPENLKKERPAPPFDLTGTWFVDLSEGFAKFMFGPPYPKFKAAGLQAQKEAAEARAKGQNYRDSIGQCYPAGMPMIMTRVWPIAMVQLPTVIYMVSNFNNSFRQIFLDGRAYSDPDIVVPTYNGESIGEWKGDTLVVRTKYFETDNHWIDIGLPISDEFEMVEKIKLINGGKTLQIEYIMTDPQNWRGEWHNTKRWNRQDYTDIGEVECLPNLNAHLPGTLEGTAVVKAREEEEKAKKEGK